MFLRIVRSIDFLASQPEWDGRTVILTGSSMGGAQALAGAGLDERVTFISVNMPAMSDHTGVLIGRGPVWPRYLKASPASKPADEKVQALRYYDTANFAARSRAAAFVNVGFIDTACPPTGVYAAYNSLRGKKTILHSTTLGHVQTPEIRAALRSAILQHVAEQRRAVR
jgi:cephalosporin-C deacetylase-like acetyl esterase